MRITRNCKKGRTTTTRRFLLAIYVPASPLTVLPSPRPPTSRRSERAHAQIPLLLVILTSFSLSSLGRIFPAAQKRPGRVLNPARLNCTALRACEHSQLATGPLLLNHIYIECYERAAMAAMAAEPPPGCYTQLKYGNKLTTPVRDRADLLHYRALRLMYRNRDDTQTNTRFICRSWSGARVALLSHRPCTAPLSGCSMELFRSICAIPLRRLLNECSKQIVRECRPDPWPPASTVPGDAPTTAGIAPLVSL